MRFHGITLYANLTYSAKNYSSRSFIMPSPSLRARDVPVGSEAKKGAQRMGAFFDPMPTSAKTPASKAEDKRS